MNSNVVCVYLSLKNIYKEKSERVRKDKSRWWRRITPHMDPAVRLDCCIFHEK